MMMDDELYDEQDDLVVDGLFSQDGSQHPSIVNSVTNDEDDHGIPPYQYDYQYETNSLQQQQQQQQQRSQHNRVPGKEGDRDRAYQNRYETTTMPQFPGYSSSSSSYPISSQILPPAPPSLSSWNHQDIKPTQTRNSSNYKSNELEEVDKYHVNTPAKNATHMIHHSNRSNTTTPPPTMILHPGSYLIRYEHMIKTQETEKMATLSHIQPMLEVLERLIQSIVYGGKNQPSIRNKNRTNEGDQDGLLIDTSAVLSKEFYLNDIQKVVDWMESPSGSASDNGISPIDIDLLRLDSQWMMVLKKICANAGERRLDIRNDDDDDDLNEYISWAEVLQLYRLCVIGMQTLEMLSTSQIVRRRTKVRTMQMFSLFEQMNTHPPVTSMTDSRTKNTHIVDSTAKLIDVPNSVHVTVGEVGQCKTMEAEDGNFNHKDRKWTHGTICIMVCFALVSLLIPASNSVGLFNGNILTQPMPWNEAPVVSPLSVVQDSQHMIHGGLEDCQKEHDKDGISSPPVDDLHFPQSAAIETTINVVEDNHSSHPINMIVVQRKTQDDLFTRTMSKVGGTATVLYLALPLISSGAVKAMLGWTPVAIVFATITNHGVQQWISKRWQQFLNKANKSVNKV